MSSTSLVWGYILQYQGTHYKWPLIFPSRRSDKNFRQIVYAWASLVAQMVKNLLTMWETCVWSLGWEDPLEEDMATHFSIVAWRIPMDRGAGGLQFMGSQRVGHDWVTKHKRDELVKCPNFRIDSIISVHIKNHIYLVGIFSGNVIQTLHIHL